MNNFLSGYKQLEYAVGTMTVMEANEKITFGIPVKVYGTFSTICMEGMASVESESKIVSGQTVFTTLLKFRAGEQPLFPWTLKQALINKDMIFRLTDVNGKTWLLGTNEMPFPITQVKHTSPGETTGANILEYEISYTNLFSLLEIV
ncbi:hypothetical protein [Dysgonomonas sp. HGC4]|uniref:hypothetical protein n=1 Tax=Dysgonomonas sp. HGC4 TaxID=1658009 RepID=UPI00068048D4|nr:hypothetical protein [Dysgonomonas sp. HGC4]MBD8349364.1 hypothetical protein [Dysgonomonas sp. HGC4]